jgi:hypothetical protein
LEQLEPQVLLAQGPELPVLELEPQVQEELHQLKA